MVKSSLKSSFFQKELRKFFFIFVFVLLIIFFIFNFGAVWQNIEYQFSRILHKIPNPEESFWIAEKKIEGNFILIPKINITAPILIPKSTSEKDFLKVLKDGVALYPNFSNPGEKGTAVITGHSSPNLAGLGKYNSVFALLGKLEYGDKIIIYFNQEKYSYKVLKKYIFSPQDEFSIIKQGQEPKLFLITCWPVGTNLKRIAIEAEIISE